ncbi:SCO family protein [Leptospira brenneri]|uniref:SCO family protein n=1 Tax=Leptospira brenneri TaxID=2023182 RepID=A0A5F1Z7G6_9LEPT|nr:SCO family protein [Leptospira brenneri]TGK95515.1 SCO family protein [Leptospira brenneri]
MKFLNLKTKPFPNQMQILSSKSILVLLSFVLIVTHCKASEPTPSPKEPPYFSGNDFDPVWTNHPKEDSKLKQIPNSLILTEHTGKQINFQELESKERLVVFFYATCRGICPLITRNLLQIEPSLSEFPDLKLVSISINPKEDTVPVLQKYKLNYKIQNPNWSFYTGEESIITKFAKETCGAEMEGFSTERGKYEFVHTENIFLFDKDQYLRGIYRAKGTGDIQRLVEDLRKLRTRNLTKAF